MNDYEQLQIDNLIQTIRQSQKKIFGTSSEKTAPRIGGIRKKMLNQLPTGIIVCGIDEDETCPVCDGELKKIGSKVVRTEVGYTPLELVVKQYVQNAYKCITCGTPNSQHEKDSFVTAKVPKNVLAHSLASPSRI